MKTENSGEPETRTIQQGLVCRRRTIKPSISQLYNINQAEMMPLSNAPMTMLQPFLLEELSSLPSSPTKTDASEINNEDPGIVRDGISTIVAIVGTELILGLIVAVGGAEAVGDRLGPDDGTNDGCVDGALEVDGNCEGTTEGWEDGSTDGWLEGCPLGRNVGVVVGHCDNVGLDVVVGDVEGALVGFRETDGDSVGCVEVVGDDDGAPVGSSEMEGDSDGWPVGSDDSVGLALGLPVGATDTEGMSVGDRVGDAVGSEVVGDAVG